MTAIELTMDDVRRDPDALHVWLLAHGLDPRRTAPGVIVRGDQVTATLYVEDEHGQRSYQRDECTGQILGVATEDVVVPLRTPVPAGLGTTIGLDTVIG